MRRGRFTKDLCVGTAQVVAVEQGQVDEGVSGADRRPMLQGVRGGWSRDADALDGLARGGEQCGRSVVAERNRAVFLTDGSEFSYAREKILGWSRRASKPQEDLVPVGIEGGRTDTRLARKHGEARDSGHRNLRGLGQAFCRAEADPHPRKAARPICDDDCAECAH